VKLLTPDDLEAELRDIGAKRYHPPAPVHGCCIGGQCRKGQVQAWALNRYYYQAMIPLKDASLIARCEDAACGANGARACTIMTASRRRRRHRALAQAHRRARARARLRHLAARAAAGHEVRRRGLCAFRAREDLAGGDRLLAHRAVLAGDHRRARRGHAEGLSFVTAETLAYFAKRPPQAKKDSDFALDYVKRNARTPAEQRLVLAALEFKCGVLWSMLDVLHFAYVAPGHIPPARSCQRNSA
jgi:pyrroloquinoline-quinone synthase